MAIKNYTPQKLEIDLSSNQGNVFYLLGVANNLCNQLDMSFKDVSDEMTSGDYKNALFVFNREFGDFVDLKLPKNIKVEDVVDSYKEQQRKVVVKGMNPEKMQEIYLK